MDAEERLRAALAKRGHERLHSEGDVYLMLAEIEEIAAEQGASEAETRHVLRRFDEQGLLGTDDGLFHQGDIALAILYEDRYNRRQLWRQNALRREVLHLAAQAFDRDEVAIDYHEDGERFVEAPYAQAVAAARALEYWGLLNLHLFLGRSFSVAITPAGYDLVRDETGVATRAASVGR